MTHMQEQRVYLLKFWMQMRYADCAAKDKGQRTAETDTEGCGQSLQQEGNHIKEQ